MPNGQSASQYFGDNTPRLNVFFVEIMSPKFRDGKSTISMDSGFTAEHDRLFFLEQDENMQWKRTSLAEKFGPDLFSTNKMVFNKQADIHKIYDLVEQEK